MTLLRSILKAFIAWKQQQGEQTGEDDHLFVGQRGAWTSQAIQQIVKKYLKKLDLYEKGKAVHALRHLMRWSCTRRIRICVLCKNSSGMYRFSQHWYMRT